MAIDPRISLTPAPTVNVGQRFGQALQNIQALDNLKMNRELAPLQQQAAQMQMEVAQANQLNLINQANMNSSELGRQIAAQNQRNQFFYNNAKSLQGAYNTGNQNNVINELKRQRNVIAPLVQNKQLPESELLEIEQALQVANTDDGLEAIKNQTSQFISQFEGDKNLPPAVAETIWFKNQSPEIQEAHLLQKRGNKPTPEQELEYLQQKSDIEISTAGAKAKATAAATRQSKIISGYTDQNKTATKAMGRAREIQKLTEGATQGVQGQAKLLASRFFSGIDASAEGALDSAYKSLTLDELSKITGPTTDFEYGVAESITGSLGEGAKANAARIASILRASWFSKEESKQFNKWLDAGHSADRFVFNFNEPITFGKGEKALTITLQDLRDTAAANHMSIEDTMKAFRKGRK